MDRQATLKLNTQLGGNAAQGLRDMTQDARGLAAAEAEMVRQEEQYQKRLQGTLADMEQRKRLQRDLVALGAIEATKSREQAYIDRANERRRYRALAAAGQGEQSAGDYLGARFGPLGRAAGGGLDALGLGASTASALGTLGLATGAAVGGMKLLEGGLHTLTPILNTMQDASLSAAQKQRRILEELPLVGSLAANFHAFSDALVGTTETLRRSAAEMAATRLVGAAVNEGRTGLAGLADSQAGRVARAAAMARLAGSTPGLTLSTEVGPEGDRQRAQQREAYALENERRRHAAELEVAKAEEDVARKRFQTVQAQSYLTGVDEHGRPKREIAGPLLEAERDRRLEAARKAQLPPGRPRKPPRPAWLDPLPTDNSLGAWGGWAAGIVAPSLAPSLPGQTLADSARRKQGVPEVAQAEGANLAVQKEALTVKQAGEALEQKGLATLQAANRLRQDGVQAEKNKLAILEQQSSRLQSAAQRWGAATIPERNAEVQIQALIARGRREGDTFRYVTPQQKALHGSFFPESTARAEQEIGRQDPMFLRLAKAEREGGSFEAGGARNIGEVLDRQRQQMEKLASSIAKVDEEGMSKLAQGAVELYTSSTDKLLETLRTAIEKYTNAKIIEIELKFVQMQQRR